MENANSGCHKEDPNLGKNPKKACNPWKIEELNREWKEKFKSNVCRNTWKCMRGMVGKFFPYLLSPL